MTWTYTRPTNDEIRASMLNVDGHTFDSRCPICGINSHIIVTQLLDEIEALKAEVERYQNPIVTIDLRPVDPTVSNAPSEEVWQRFSDAQREIHP